MGKDDLVEKRWEGRDEIGGGGEGSLECIQKGGRWVRAKRIEN